MITTNNTVYHIKPYKIPMHNGRELGLIFQFSANMRRSYLSVCLLFIEGRSKKFLRVCP